MKKLLLLLLISSAIAEDIKTNDGKEYKDVTILGADPDALRIMYPSGVTRITFENLPKEIQKKYNYDPIKAKEFEQKEKEKATLSDQAYLENNSHVVSVPVVESDRDKLVKQLSVAEANRDAYDAKKRALPRPIIDKKGHESGSPISAKDYNVKWKELEYQRNAWNNEASRIRKELGMK